MYNRRQYSVCLAAGIILILAGSVVLHAQQRRIDSLQSELKRYSSMKGQQKKVFSILLDMSAQYGVADRVNAKRCAEEAIKVARGDKNTVGEIEALLQRGSLASSESDWNEAISDYELVYKIANAHKLHTYASGALNNIAVVYQRQGKYMESLEMHHRSLEIKREHNDERGMAASYINLGVINRQLGYLDVAVKYYELAKPIVEKTSEKQPLANIYNNLGNAYYEMKDYSKALEYYKASLVLYEQLENVVALGRGYSNMGSILSKMGDTAKANPALLKGYQYLMRIKTPNALSQAYRGIGRLFENRNRSDSAMHYYRMSYKIGRDVGEPMLKFDALRLMTELSQKLERHAEVLSYCDTMFACLDERDAWPYREDVYTHKLQALIKLGRYQEAYDIYAKYRATKDTLFLREHSKRLDELGVQYKVQLTEHENLVLKKQQELDQAALAKKNSELTLVEKERRLQELQLENRTRALQLQRENAGRDAQTIQILEKDRDLRNVQLEKERWLSSLWFTAVLALGLITFLLVILYRTRKLSLIQYKEKNTELTKASEEIIQQQEELRSQNEQLEALNFEKNEILAVAAHDLKNPIGSVLGLAQLLNHPDTPEFARQECLNQIENSTRKMLKLVSNLLDIDKIDSGKKEILRHPADLAAILSDTVEQNIPHAHEKGIRIVLDSSRLKHRVLSDQSTLIQIIDNLVSNAIKFSPFDSMIIITADSEREAVRIEVTDQGPGISEEDRSQLFTKFARLSARPTGNEVSTGLGLYIVKRLVEALGGTIRCESEPGKGARFIVEIPAALSQSSKTDERIESERMLN